MSAGPNPTGDYISDVINLLLERLDNLGELLERIAIAMEKVNPE
jgi:hypothetical protein